MSIFKITYHQALLIAVFLFVCTAGCSNTTAENAGGYTIMPAQDAVSTKWGHFLYNELCRRAGHDGFLLLNEEKKGYKTIHVMVDGSFPKDIMTRRLANGELILKARNEEGIAWLVYQVMKNLADEDRRIDATGLLPAVIGCGNYAFDFNFSYREPHLHISQAGEMYNYMLATHSLEKEWGIWGHNLGKILHGDESNSIYARQNGKTELSQYCFSSNETYSQLREYIIDNFGQGDEYRQRFMIMPQDNNIVCNCTTCKALGNTPGNATPAVHHLVKRLAECFPGHLFFTSAYLTTRQPYHCNLPPNTGVMISTIELPKGIGLCQRKEVKPFINHLNAWKACTPHVYVWDYAANFDDYLTPLPILCGLKKQLRFYKMHAVEGIFLNASGYDYSPFEDVKAYVASALMIDPAFSVDSLCRGYFKSVYPVAGKTLAGYYMSLEKKFSLTNKPYNLYGGFREALKLYLDKSHFVAFYETLPSLIKAAGKEEKEKLEKLYTALSYTRLQIAYHDVHGPYGFAKLVNKTLYPNPGIKTVLDGLARYSLYEDMKRYKESGGELDKYLNRWREISRRLPFTNLLLGQPLQVFSKLDPEYSDISILTDGVYGFQEDYHQGWLINSAETLELGFDTRQLKKASRLSLNFLVNRRHKIKLPERVEVYKDNVLFQTLIPVPGEETDTSAGAAMVTLDMEFVDAAFITLKIIRGKGTAGTIACDEITIN